MFRGSKRIRDERGAVLVIALVILAYLTIIGILAASTSTTDIQIANNEKLHNIVFYAADAGIEVGRAALNDLKVSDAGSWDNLLQGVTTLDNAIDANGSRNMGPASFTLAVEDNEDLDGSDEVDTDNTVFLTATGFLQSEPGVETRIRATVHYTGGGDEYSQEHYDTDNSGMAAREGTAVAGSRRW